MSSEAVSCGLIGFIIGLAGAGTATALYALTLSIFKQKDKCRRTKQFGVRSLIGAGAFTALAYLFGYSAHGCAEIEWRSPID